MNHTNIHVVSMDETAVWLDAISNRTIDLKGAKTIILKSAQNKPLSYISRTKNCEIKVQAAALISDFTVLYG